jgi:hypothetical protein
VVAPDPVRDERRELEQERGGLEQAGH